MADKPVDDNTAVAPAPAPSPAPQPSPVPPEPAAPVLADGQPAASPAAPAAETNLQTAGAASTGTTEEKLPPSLLEAFDATKEKPAEAPKPTDKPEAKPTEGPRPDAKPAETKPTDGVKPPEAVAQPAEPVKVDYWKDVKLPETIKADDAQRADVAGALDLIRGGKSTEGVQKLVDLHNKVMTDFVEKTRRDQWDTFRQTNKDWQTRVMADPILGGAGHNTAMGAVARMRDMAVSSHRPGTAEYTADAKEFQDFLNSTGAGNHPAFLRMLHNFARFFDEPPMPPAEIRPPTNNGQAPGDRRARLYPTMQERR